ncbi:hypothetical protein ASV26_08640 [Klebsiella aerogenes]|nr:hypothetical protein ASV26_08640 [Klebsiella aerogenes]
MELLTKIGRVLLQIANHAKQYVIILFLIALTYNTVVIPVLKIWEIDAPKMMIITEEHAKSLSSLLMIGTN